MDRRATQPSPLSPTNSKDSAFLIPLQDIVFGDVQSSAKEREEDSLSVETAHENSELWEDDRFSEECAQPLVEEEDPQLLFEEELLFPESTPHNSECLSCVYAGCV